MSSVDCIFCRVIDRISPAHIVYETDYTLAFLDKFPLSRGHTLLVPKKHFVTLSECEDEFLSDVLICAKKVAIALGVPNYNLLQNNGRLAYQAVFHAHFHLIPKSSINDGLRISWQTPDDINSNEQLTVMASRIREKLALLDHV